MSPISIGDMLFARFYAEFARPTPNPYFSFSIISLRMKYKHIFKYLLESCPHI